MLIYGYKGKCCPTSTLSTSEKNVFALVMYNNNILGKDGGLPTKFIEETYLRQVYNTYSTLCKFNNLLVSDDIENSLSLLNDYLTNNEDIATQTYDSKIRGIYDDLRVCRNRLQDNSNSLSDIKKKIVSLMKHYSRFQGTESWKNLFQVASINQQINYDDYT